MLAPFTELLHSRHGGLIVGAFTCYNLETAVGALQAVEERNAGVVLLVSERSLRARSGEMLVSALLAVAGRSRAPACVQLDHVSDLTLIDLALELGVGSIMADGSRLPFDENVAFVAEAVRRAGRHGATVEAELGAIAGDEDVASAVAAGALTHPEEAAEFVKRSGAACLAISIGNVHGVYRAPPSLDLARLKAIRENVSVPLSLHGASGLPEQLVRRSIRAGIAKVNVNTELRERYLETTASLIDGVRDGLRVFDLNAAQVEAVRTGVRTKLVTFASTG